MQSLIIVTGVQPTTLIFGRSIWELDHKESWVSKNWCFQILLLEKALESPLDSKEIKPVNLKRTQRWIFTGRMVPKLQNFGHLMQRADSLEKTVMLERLRAGGEVGSREWDGWMASLTQWSWVWMYSRKEWRTENLVCCNLWGHKQLDMTLPLNNNNNMADRQKSTSHNGLTVQTDTTLHLDTPRPIARSRY